MKVCNDGFGKYLPKYSDIVEKKNGIMMNANDVGVEE